MEIASRQVLLQRMSEESLSNEGRFHIVLVSYFDANIISKVMHAQAIPDLQIRILELQGHHLVKAESFSTHKVEENGLQR